MFAFLECQLVKSLPRTTNGGMVPRQETCDGAACQHSLQDKRCTAYAAATATTTTAGLAATDTSFFPLTGAQLWWLLVARKASETLPPSPYVARYVSAKLSEISI